MSVSSKSATHSVQKKSFPPVGDESFGEELMEVSEPPKASVATQDFVYTSPSNEGRDDNNVDVVDTTSSSMFQDDSPPDKKNSKQGKFRGSGRGLR